MAEVQSPTGASAKDTALMTLSIVALLAGIVAFYWYDELALPFRVAMVVAGLAAGAGLMWFTWYGREFWQFALAARGTFDPVAILGVGFAAGIEQANNSYAGYGQGAAGYGKRFAAKFANGRSSDFLTHAVFPSLLHQDPRYFYQGSGSVKSRLLHAVGSAFFTRSDSGRTVPNYSYLLGDMSAGALSNLYYPAANRGAHLVFTNAAVGLAGRVGGNLLREFLSKRLTTNVPGNGRQ